MNVASNSFPLTETGYQLVHQVSLTAKNKHLAVYRNPAIKRPGAYLILELLGGRLFERALNLNATYSTLVNFMYFNISSRREKGYRYPFGQKNYSKSTSFQLIAKIDGMKLQCFYQFS